MQVSYWPDRVLVMKRGKVTNVSKEEAVNNKVKLLCTLGEKGKKPLGCTARTLDYAETLFRLNGASLTSIPGEDGKPVKFAPKDFFDALDAYRTKPLAGNDID